MDDAAGSSLSGADRWGETLQPRAPISRAAIAIAAVTLATILLTLLWMLLAVAWQGSMANPPLFVVLGFLIIVSPYLLVLASYVLLGWLPAGGPAAGRGLVWLTLACGYLGIIWPLAVLFPVIAPQHTVAIAACGVIAFLGHLIKFASESTGARYVTTALLILLALSGLLLPWMQYSREQARSSLMLMRLKQLGLGFQSQQMYLDGRTPEPIDIERSRQLEQEDNFDSPPFQ